MSLEAKQAVTQYLISKPPAEIERFFTSHSFSDDSPESMSWVDFKNAAQMLHEILEVHEVTHEKDPYTRRNKCHCFDAEPDIRLHENEAQALISIIGHENLSYMAFSVTH